MNEQDFQAQLSASLQTEYMIYPSLLSFKEGVFQSSTAAMSEGCYYLNYQSNTRCLNGVSIRTSDPDLRDWRWCTDYLFHQYFVRRFC